VFSRPFSGASALELIKQGEAAYIKEDFLQAKNLWLQSTAKFPNNNPYAIDDLLTFANRFHEAGYFEGSERFYLMAIKKGDSMGESLRTVNALSELGFQYEEQGHYPEASGLFDRAISMRKNVAKKAPLDSFILEEGARLDVHAGRFADAERCYREEIIVQNQMLRNRSDEDRLLVLIAAIKLMRHDYVSAERLCTKILGITDVLDVDSLQKLDSKITPNFPPLVFATALNTLADVYSEQHRYEAAKALYARAVPICKDWEEQSKLRKDRSSPEILRLTDYYFPSSVGLKQKLTRLL